MQKIAIKITLILILISLLMLITATPKTMGLSFDEIESSAGGFIDARKYIITTKFG